MMSNHSSALPTDEATTALRALLVASADGAAESAPDPVGKKRSAM